MHYWKSDADAAAHLKKVLNRPGLDYGTRTRAQAANGCIKAIDLKNRTFFEYTSSSLNPFDRPTGKIFTYCGIFDLSNVVIYTLSSGEPRVSYSIGTQGLQSRELTPEQAIAVREICEDACLPPPIIRGFVGVTIADTNPQKPAAVSPGQKGNTTSAERPGLTRAAPTSRLGNP